MDWTRCEPDCVSPTPHQAHCTVCHKTFGGIRLFDRHRKDGVCLDPAGLGMVLTEKGVWRVPMSDEDREKMIKLRAQ